MARSGAGQLWPVRGVMVDAGRLIERHEFYFDLLERMARWGLNTLWLHLTDDEGFMLKLDSHPELASAHAFTRRGIKRLVTAAAGCGVDVVPEVESLGHARCITRLPQYAELADGGPFGFNAVCPSHPRTPELLGEIVTEVAGLFPSRYFHAGLDEVDLGDCPRCRRRGRGRPKWWVFARHVRKMHEIITGAGKEMIVWADHVAMAPDMLRALPEDVILAHWQYGAVNSAPIRRSLGAGFRVIGCPALCRSGDMIMPNAANFRNMDDMTEALGRLRPGRRVLGLVNTFWTSWRGLRDAYLPAVAYTGAMLAGRGPVNRKAFFRRWTKDFFGLADAQAAGALERLHEEMIGREEVAALLCDSISDARAALGLSEREDFPARGRRIAQAAGALARAAPKVRAHREEFAALVLAGRTADLCCRRAGQLAAAFEEYRLTERDHTCQRPPDQVTGHLAAAAEVIGRMQDELREVSQAARAEWRRTRYPRDPKTWPKPTRYRRRDDLLLALDRAERFGAKMLGDLRRAIRGYGRTGEMPGGV